MKRFTLLFLLSGCASFPTPDGLASGLDLDEDGRITAEELEQTVLSIEEQANKFKEQASELNETKLRLEERTSQVKGFTDLFQGITQANNKCIESLTEHANECLTNTD